METAGLIGALRSRIEGGQTVVSMKEELDDLDSNQEDATKLVPIIIGVIKDNNDLDRGALLEKVLEGVHIDDEALRMKNQENASLTIRNLIAAGVLQENKEKNNAVQVAVEIK